ncbi:MAG: threonine/serine dehydratase [SAR202 cluster bacterium]|nr:threonine/serine dehydratase [SAR202 cluster bacterium]
MDQRPTLLDIVAAKKRIAPYITRTPLHRYLTLDKLLDAQVYVKHENHQRLGSFKMRGGVNYYVQLTPDEKRRGVIGSSTGNHGQSIAYAGSLFGVQTVIVVPNGANSGKVESMRLLGGKVVFHGKDFDEAREHVEVLAKEEGYKYLHSANEPALIAGVGTYTLEIMEDLPDVDVIIVPIGGGSGACGVCIAAKSLNPKVKVIGVSAAKAPAAYLSWKNRTIAESKMETIAEGLATRVGFELTQSILWDLLDDYVLVTEEELEQAVVLHLEKTHNLTEHAGAASLAAALKAKDRLKGKRVALVISGGNLSIERLKQALGKRFFVT